MRNKHRVHERHRHDAFILGQKAQATKYKDNSDLNTFTRFCFSIKETRNIENIPEVQLNNILCQFFINAKTKKGTFYEPDTLTGIQNSLQRVLVARGSKIDLREGAAYIKSRQVLASCRKELTKLGKGNKENAARSITPEEVDYLFDTGYFGTANPVVLQRSVWCFLTQHFGHRARDEGLQLKYGDIKVEREFRSGNEYLVWLTERSTKTRTGERPLGDKRAFNPKAFATGTEKCPVNFFKQFISHRPIKMCEDDAPLFLQVRYNIDYNSEIIWFYEKPLGKNSIGQFMSKARTILNSENANKGKISNHSARKPTITNLLNENINPLHVQQISSRKKLESLNQYNTASLSIQKQISNVISSGKSSSDTSLESSLPLHNNR